MASPGHNELILCQSVASPPAPDVRFVSSSHNNLGHKQNGWHYVDDICNCIFLNKSCCILIQISLKFVLKGPTDIKPSLVQVMAWHLFSTKPLPGPMVNHWCMSPSFNEVTPICPDEDLLCQGGAHFSNNIHHPGRPILPILIKPEQVSWKFSDKIGKTGCRCG